jgi:lactose/cellobiose-specific phosphotransferase system IIC component
MAKMSSLDNLAQKASNIEVIRVIRKGLIYMMPLVLIGSFIVMVLNLPVAAFQNFLNTIFTNRWRDIALAIHNGTFQIMSLATLLAISYTLASEKQIVASGEVNAISVMLTAFASYVAFTWEDGFIIRAEVSDSKGMFGAIVISLLSTYLFLFLCRIQKRNKRLFAFDSDSVLVYTLNMVIPTFVTVFLFGFARLLIEVSGMKAFIGRAYDGMAYAFVQNQGSIFAAIIFTLITHTLWFFGLHGTNILDGVAKDLFITATHANVSLAESGMMPAHILTKEFFDAFVYLGGSGCTLGLTIALIIAGKSSNVNRVAKYSILQGIFNINEMMVYGLPIIFNPYYIIPFLFTPCVLCITTYIAMYTGMVPFTVTRVEWTTPIFLSGYVSTGGSFAAVILQAVNLAISALLYLPFIKLYEKHLTRNNMDVFKKLSGEIIQTDVLHKQPVLNRSDGVGVLARTLATEIETGLHDNADTIHMEYQPKVNARGKVTGAEALLRWTHPVYGYVSPLVILGLADEAGMGNKLGNWTITRAFGDMKKMWDLGYKDFALSVNLTPKQLQNDPTLVETINAVINKTGLPPSCMELELTENAAIDQSESTRHKLRQLKDLGVNISIDDFGMGNSSILYLRDLYANVVKIDISLVRTITTDKHSQEIVNSIVQLCRQLDVGLIAEGVETREQVDKLSEIGCTYYQGFYFSRSLPFDKFLAYIKEHGNEQHSL